MYKKTVFILILCFTPIGLRAENKFLTLERAVEEVLASNPDVQAVHYRTAAAKARIPQAKALEDPQIGIMFEDVPRDTIRVNQAEQIDYRVEQKIPFPGKRHTRGKASRFESEAVSESSRGKIRDILLDLKETYYTLYRLDRSVEVNRKNQSLLRELAGATESSYATGKTTADAPIKAQLELTKLKNEEMILQRDTITHKTHLKALLNQTSHEDFLLPEKISWPRLNKTLDELVSLSLQKRPEIKTMEALQKKDRSQLTAARQSLIPDFSLGFQYGQRPMSKDTWSGTAMINLPIFFWSKNRGQIQEAKASLKATELEKESMQIHGQHDIQQAYSSYEAAQKILITYEKEILPQARANMETARMAYTTKKVDFLTVMDAVRNYHDFQMSYFESQANVGTSFAQLERLVGIDLNDSREKL